MVEARADDTHHWGKDHSLAGLQFNKTGFDRKRKYVALGI